MKNYKVCAVITSLFLIITAMDSVATNRTALVIGNGDYKSAWLKTPVNDAEDMANVLTETGFKVTLKTNVTLREMDTAVREFGKALQRGGIGLFYYAGHGLHINKSNYLIPIDAKIETESDVKYEAVDAGRILDKMKDAGNKLNIVILDACRKNPFSRNFRTSNDGLTFMDVPIGSLIAYASVPGRLAVDGDGRNSLYSKHLIENIKTPGLTIEQALKNVRIAVTTKTLNQQVPWESSLLKGNFYFNEDKQIVVKSSGIINNESKADREKLEMDRKRLEKLEHQIMEQEQKLQQNQHIQIASLDTQDQNSKIIARDGHYIKYSNDIVYDKKSGLEWFAGPDKSTGGFAAKKWVENLKLDGGRWRMPTIIELKGLLYKSETGTYDITSLLGTSSLFVWSSNVKGLYFYYGTVGDGTWSSGMDRYLHHFPRAFAIRVRK